MLLKWLPLCIIGCIIVLPMTFSIDSDSSIQVFFCPLHDCESVFLEFLEQAQESIFCAIYELHLESLIEVLDYFSEKITVSVVVEKDATELDRAYVVYDTNPALMHNKFCVVDGELLLTGSANPTPNEVRGNNNNIVILKHKGIAAQFKNQAEILISGERRGAPSYNKYQLGDIGVEAFFCPEDSCADRLISLIRSAEEEIIFATFTFTDIAIGHELLLAADRNVSISGVYERRMHTLHSTFAMLQYQGVDVFIDTNPRTLHHKFFVIDRKIVFTGSYNPTLNGNTRNNENVLVIHDTAIAQKYVAEFQRLV